MLSKANVYGDGIELNEVYEIISLYISIHNSSDTLNEVDSASACHMLIYILYIYIYTSIVKSFSKSQSQELELGLVAIKKPILFGYLTNSYTV